MREQVLDPGSLRYQITWQRKVQGAQNSFGEPAITLADVVTLKASVRQFTGREMVAVMQRWPEARYLIEHHWYSGLDTSMQIAWYVDGVTRTLDVLDIRDEAGTQRVLRITAKDHEQ